MSLLPWIGLAAGLLGALVVGALLAAGRRVPPVLGALPVALPLLASLVALRLGMHEVRAVVPTLAPEARLVAYDAGVALALHPVSTVLLASALPTLVVLLGCAVGGARRGPRQATAAVVVGILVLPLALAPLLSMGHVEDGLLLLAPPVLGLLGLLAAVAALAGGREAGAGPESSATAGLALALGSVSFLAGLLTRNLQLVFEASAHSSPEIQPTMWAAGQVVVQALEGAVWVGFGVASTAALAALAAIAGLSTGRRVGALAGLAWLVGLPPLFSGINPSAEREAFLEQEWRVLVPYASHELDLARIPGMFEVREALGDTLPPGAWPSLESVQRPVMRQHLDLGRTSLRVNGELLRTLDGQDGLEVDALAEELAQRQGAFAVVRFRGSVLLKVHREVPWSQARAVLAASAQAGSFETDSASFELLVNAGDHGPLVLPVASAPGHAPEEEGLPDEPPLVLDVTRAGYRLVRGEVVLEIPCTLEPCAPVGSSTHRYDVAAVARALFALGQSTPPDEVLRIQAEPEVPWEAVVLAVALARVVPDGTPPHLDPRLVLDP